MFMRLDKLLCEMNIGTRSKVKELIKSGQVLADGKIIKKPEIHVDEIGTKIICQGKEYQYQPYIYYMMNKPPGVITATTDGKERTVLDVLREQLVEQKGSLTGIPIKDIFPAGRLDKDTVGLLILTNDGSLAHNILSPAKHVPKTYLVKTQSAISPQMADRLKKGVLIGEKERTLPAVITMRKEDECTLTITEGRYHQVKRMFQAVGTNVIYLKRLSMGNLWLDKELEEGQVRELTQKEVMELCLKK